MKQKQQDKTQSLEQVDIIESADEHFGLIPDDDSIQLQSPEAIAFDGLLSDLELLASTYNSMAERHLENWHGTHNFITNTPRESIIAYGIYANKAQDMRDLVNKWKPNKK